VDSSLSLIEDSMILFLTKRCGINTSILIGVLFWITYTSLIFVSFIQVPCFFIRVQS